MKTAVIALTKTGCGLALKIGQALGAQQIYVKHNQCLDGSLGEKERVVLIKDDFKSLIGNLFYTYDVLVFIMACGIVIRTIAPYIQSKTTDPAVIVLDEKGQHIISLLSGHVGGANKMAETVAGITGGTPVITTSTDVNQVIAFDVFALENGLVIENKECLKYISGELVNGNRIGLYVDGKLKGPVPSYIELLSGNPNHLEQGIQYGVVVSNRTDLNIDASLNTDAHYNTGGDFNVDAGCNINTHLNIDTGKVLFLRPKNLVLGIGCKKGTTKAQIRQAVEDFMEKHHRSLHSIKCMATIDLKQEETGLLEYCEEVGLDLKIIMRKEIENIEENFTCSEFVKTKIGVGSVAEPCAILASLRGVLITGKTRYPGITLALSEEMKEYSL